jgi:predicted ArsR family transcriptional regulator
MPVEEAAVPDQLQALCSLADPTRAALYEHVAERDEPVSRDEAAAAVGVARPVAAYHLDKLVEEGLLEPSFARPEGRRGPGAGRPAKYYRATQTELEVSVPPRGYRLAARLLARAVSAAATADARGALERDARALGEALATDPEAPPRLWDVLRRLGYRPYRDGPAVRLRNCPFRQLAQEHTELICGMNVALLAGVAAAAADSWVARLDPGPARCCVILEPAVGHASTPP